MSVLDARAIRWDHVFLLGCGEGQFPQKVTDLSLLSEKERQTWAQRGIDLDCRSDLTAREMLLFYLAVSRADKTLTLSYHQGDSVGGTSAAGSFLQSLMEKVGGEETLEANGQITRIKPGQFIPETDGLTTPREAMNAAITGLFQQTEFPSKSALGWIVGNRPKLLTRVGSGLWASHKRWKIPLSRKATACKPSHIPAPGSTVWWRRRCAPARSRHRARRRHWANTPMPC